MKVIKNWTKPPERYFFLKKHLEKKRDWWILKKPSENPATNKNLNKCVSYRN